MADFVVDTHTLFWHLTSNAKLGKQAARVMNAAANSGDALVVPSIVMAELYFLNIKLGLPLDYARTYAALRTCAEYEFVDFTGADILAFDSHAIVPEMHDRIIVGVAVARQASVLTKDQPIVNSGLVPTVW
jgi:PIN domain nuclease of toxin-antitoxin system